MNYHITDAPPVTPAPPAIDPVVDPAVTALEAGDLTTTTPSAARFVDSNEGSSGRRPRFTWTPSLERLYVRELLKVSDQGRKPSGRWKFSTWSRFLKNFEAASGFTLSHIDTLRTKERSLKKLYHATQKLLRDSETDEWEITVDPESMRITCALSVWNDYVKKNPEAAPLLRKPPGWFHELAQAYGDIAASGEELSPLKPFQPEMLDGHSSKRQRLEGAPYSPSSPSPPDEDGEGEQGGRVLNRAFRKTPQQKSGAGLTDASAQEVQQLRARVEHLDKLINRVDQLEMIVKDLVYKQVTAKLSSEDGPTQA